jgi:hypothetical protein
MHFFCPKSKSAIENLKLSNYPIGSGQNVGWQCQTDLFSGFEVDHQLKLGWLLDGKVGGLGTFEDSVHEVRCATK